MPTRRRLVALLCAAAAGCSTASSLESRPLQSGVSRTFPASFERISAAVDAAIETLPVNIIAPANVGQNRVARFDRPVTPTGWGESGRVVIARVDAHTTRVTVAVDPRDPAQPSARTERGYADRIFLEVQAALSADRRPPEGAARRS
ncbi:MAG: hypothetical protein H7124_08785 [Phycisphaerales bacterium]|nr:hypothetical protein [Hyphomonadaceae bacterium]